MGFLADVLGCGSGKLLRRTNIQNDTRKGLIKREVNMRASPALNAEILSRLQPGSEVLITDCALKPDTQGVWYRVETGKDTGWISGRFVYENLVAEYLPIDR